MAQLCKKCGVYFPKRGQRWCRSCHRIYMQKWRASVRNRLTKKQREVLADGLCQKLKEVLPDRHMIMKLAVEEYFEVVL